MKKFILFLLLTLAFTSEAQLKLARLFSDHVVLQRQKPIAVWGWANAGQEVTVSLGTATANKQNGCQWQVDGDFGCHGSGWTSHTYGKGRYQPCDRK